MKRRFILLLVLMLAAQTAVAQNRLTLQTVQVGDSDDARQSGFYLKYRRALSREKFLGGGAGTHDFSDNFGSRRFSVLTAEYRQPLPGPFTFRAEAAQYLSSEWSPFTGNASLIITPDVKWRIEAMIGWDLVDTYTAIELENQFSTIGLSADYLFHKDWTLVGFIFRQDFKDDNVRSGLLGRLIWEISYLDWLRAELNFRALGNDIRGVGYFSPDKLIESYIQATASKVMFDENAVFSALLGLGIQSIDDADPRALFLGELRGRGWFTEKWGMTGRVGARNTGDTNFSTGGEEYLYWYLKLDLIYAW